MSDEIKDKDGIEGQNPDNLQDSQNNDLQDTSKDEIGRASCRERV